VLIAEDAYYREVTVAKKQRHKRQQQKKKSYSAAAYKKSRCHPVTKDRLSQTNQPRQC
jgi:hypothetical protein